MARRRKARKRKRPRRSRPAPSPPTTPQPTPKPTPRGPRRQPVLALLVGAGVLALALVWGLVARPTSDQSLPLVRPPELAEIDPVVRSLIDESLEAAASAPDSGEMRGRLGLVYAANDLWDEARQTLAQAAELAPDDFLWRYHQALAARRAGDLETSLELLQELSESEPDFAPAIQRLAAARLARGELPEALQAYRRVAELEPMAPDGYLGTAEVLILDGRHREAIAQLEVVSGLDPGFPGYHYLSALAYRGLGETETAEGHFSRHQETPPRFLSDPYTERMLGLAVNLTAQLARAGLEMQNGDLKAAEAILAEALVQRGDEVRLMNPLAMVYLASGRVSEARELLLRAYELNTQELATAMNLASAALRLGDAADALRRAEHALTLAPEAAQAHFVRAVALSRTGRRAEAREAARTAASFDSQNPMIQRLVRELEAQPQ